MLLGGLSGSESGMGEWMPIVVPEKIPSNSPHNPFSHSILRTRQWKSQCRESEAPVDGTLLPVVHLCLFFIGC